MAKYIDLFAGCGGLSLGLYKAQWKGLFAIEKSPLAFKTLEWNLIDKVSHFDWPIWLPKREHDIDELIDNYRDELSSLNGRVSLVVGGPPCQGFSTAGKRKEDDERNRLVNSYIEIIRIIRPKLLFFENVRGFDSGFRNKDTRGKAYSGYVWENIEKLGYNVHGKILNFADYGIPQRRKRFILVGSLVGNAESFFEKLDEQKIEFLKSHNLKPNQMLKNAISDLLKENGIVNSPDTIGFNAGIYSAQKSNYQKFIRNGSSFNGEAVDSHRFPNHRNETVVKFRYIIKNLPKGGNIVNDIKVKYRTKKSYMVLLDKDQPSPTLTSLPDDYIHYSEPRILTVREYARIQTFPDWFEFKGKYTTGNTLRRKEVPRYTQVGNAIPPLFAELSGLVLKKMLDNG